jgi:hypothetical protein
MVSYRNSIVLMNDDGSDVQELFEVNENGIQRIEMSPQGTYVGYVNALGELKVYTRGGTLVARVDFGYENSVQVLDFSPDETKVYLSFGYSQMLIYSVPDLVLLSSNELGGGGCWKDNNELLVYHKDLGGVGVYDFLNSTMTHLFPFSVNEMVYVSSENVLFSLGSSVVYRYELGAESYTEVGFSWDPYEYNDFTGKQISPDGEKIVMSYDSIENVGIYILTIENSQIQRIK